MNSRISWWRDRPGSAVRRPAIRYRIAVTAGVLILAFRSAPDEFIANSACALCIGVIL